MIAVYASPESLDQATYEKIGQRLVDAGAPEGGRSHHSCFGQPGQLAVYEIWDSQESYDAFAAVLLPILQEEGVSLSRPPDVMPIVAVR